MTTSATTGTKAREESGARGKALRPRASHNYFYSRFREMKTKLKIVTRITSIGLPTG
jgi:hypothetical protein